jgi:hypothetical protein
MKRSEYLAMRKEEYLEKLASEPFEVRREKYSWKFVLDENKKVLEKPIYKRIMDIDTQILRKIIDEKDYNNNTNDDIVLRTVWDEYHYRRSNKIK